MKTFPYMLIMRNSPSGSIWQAYKVRNEKEVELLSKSARANGFLVQEEEQNFTNETHPGWRDSQEWKDYLAGRLSERALGQAASREILKNIRRDGAYWLGGYNDWLVSCFSLRNPSDFQGFTPVACWSEKSSIPPEFKISLLGRKYTPQDTCCNQWMVCIKDNQFYVDYLCGANHGRDFGLKPKLATEQTYPPHIYNWIFKDVIPKYLKEKG